VSYGKKALLIGGKTDPGSDRISVWAFDTESECWSLMEAKGDIPVGIFVCSCSCALVVENRSCFEALLSCLVFTDIKNQH
ncbi:acyl-CoA-binding domain protein, partial [Trifolium medium]|nr:acyl-CoA-binding domain protein [Trifolium medium]